MTTKEEKPGEVEQCECGYPYGYGYHHELCPKAGGRQPAAPAEGEREETNIRVVSTPTAPLEKYASELFHHLAKVVAENGDLRSALAASKAREGELQAEVVRQQKRIDDLRQSNSAMDVDLHHHRRDYRELKENEAHMLSELSAAQAEIARLKLEADCWEATAKGVEASSKQQIARLRGLLEECEQSGEIYRDLRKRLRSALAEKEAGDASR